MVTKDGELWMGCLEGVVRVNLKRKVKGKFDWKHYRTKLDDPKSGVQEKITAFARLLTVPCGWVAEVMAFTAWNGERAVNRDSIISQSTMAWPITW